MSLINEALKRAKEAQQEPPSKKSAKSQRSKAAEPAMRPVEVRQQSGSPAVYILSAALILVLLGAVAMLWMWSKSQGQTVAQNSVAKVQPPAPVLPPVAPAATPPPPAAVKAPEPPVVEVKPIVSPEPVQVATNEPISPPTPEPVVPAVPQFPILKLQGIFYNAAKPAVVINGKTYGVGGVVSGARITAIETDKVTVEWNGETRVIETAQ